MDSNLKETVKLEILDKALELSGKNTSFVEFLKKGEGRIRLNSDRFNKWQNWGIQHLQKRLKLSEKEAEIEMSWIYHTNCEYIEV